MASSQRFVVRARDTETSARVSTLTLPHGEMMLPAFMPVGTAGAVKAIGHDTLHELGYRLILGNTYHLYLRPGVDTLSKMGGLHRFSTWNHNILTDSGGYQVFSLAARRTIRDEGVTFQSHIDGSRHQFTPESVVDIQCVIGSDIQMALDVCTGADEGRGASEEALRVTGLWAGRARSRWRERREEGYAGLFAPIVQGNFFPDLRARAVSETLALDPEIVAIGGLSVGESFAQFDETLGYTAELLPRDIPRYVMGIGTPDFVLAAIGHGIDMFDCVFPTRAGRTGTIFTTRGRFNLRNATLAHRDDPPDPLIDSFGGRGYSLGYLRHLFKAGEVLGPMLATRHNLAFLAWLVSTARARIVEGTFASFRREIFEVYPPGRRVEAPGGTET